MVETEIVEEKPKLTEETKDEIQISEKNILKDKIKIETEQINKDIEQKKITKEEGITRISEIIESSKTPKIVDVTIKDGKIKYNIKPLSEIKVKTPEGFKDFENIELKARRKAIKNIKNIIKDKKKYVDKLTNAENLIKRGDVKKAESLIEEDLTYELSQEIINEEIKLLQKTVQPLIKQVTGQTKPKDIIKVDTRVELKRQLRKEAKAAREAYKAGKFDEALRAKEKQKRILEKLNIKKAKTNINKLLKKAKVKKKSGKPVGKFDYKTQAVLDKLAIINKLNKKESAEELDIRIATYKYGAMPTYAETLENKLLYSKTIDMRTASKKELEFLNNFSKELSNFQEIAETKRSLKKVNVTYNIEGTVKEIIEILSGLETRMGGGGRSDDSTSEDTQGEVETKMGGGAR